VRTVQIRLTGRHVDLDDEIRSYTEDKLQRLDRYYDRIHEVEVIFDHESEQLNIETIVRAGHKQTFVAKESGPDPYALVDILVEKLERQLKKHKEKQRNHKGGASADGGEA
jgi:putative sigma-54 modulation protein